MMDINKAEAPNTSPSKEVVKDVQPLPQPGQPTNSTRERAEGVKAYIENKYSRLKNEEKEKREAWEHL